MVYSGIERFFLLDKERVDFTDPDDINPNLFESYKKDIEFTMTLNGSLFRLASISIFSFFLARESLEVTLFSPILSIFAISLTE